MSGRQVLIEALTECIYAFDTLELGAGYQFNPATRANITRTKQQAQSAIERFGNCSQCGNPPDHMIHRDNQFRDGQGKVVYHEFD